IPPVIKNLIIINGLVWLAEITMGNSVFEWMINNLALHDAHSQFFKPHQLVTYMFLHDNHEFQHILFNMFALWMFGAVLENYWGGKRFLVFYMISGIGAAVAQLLVLYHETAPIAAAAQQYYPEDRLLFLAQSGVDNPTLGASGAVFGCLAAFGYLFPNQYIYLYFFVPIKVKWFVLGYAAIELFSGVNSAAGDNVAHWAHLGGGLVGLLLVIYWNRTNRRNFY
ncbi:MAG TPA: rhomboid family intramembrane serine protease, partial [Puia sp.]|nr:rhomboid family intramembrane serine protease [Puia sp.]